MRVENKRIFICDLPETTTQDDLQNAFNNYGTVTSVEIKERKELGLKNNSLFFAFANVDIDDRSLQSCFKDFGNAKWFGERVVLQVARESFLDRLKREREETNVSNKETGVFKKEGLDSLNIQPKKIDVITTRQLKQEKIEKYESVDSSNEDSESSSDEDIKPKILKQLNGNNFKTEAAKTRKRNQIDESDVIDLVIKNNKGKLIDKNGLKIESVGKSPIFTIDTSKKKLTVNSSDANLRRLQSLNNLKKAHKTQKSIIQQALSNIDSNSQKKIVFDDTENHSIQESTRVNKKSKKSLFDEEHQEDDFEPNFEIKEQFQGEKGQKLLELQARYKNDKRFNLDARFLDDDEDQKETDNQKEDDEEMALEEEKKKEYEILEQVLGRKVTPKSQHKKLELESQKKVMLRFDPTQPEHSKFELKHEVVKEKKKRKRENAELDLLNEKKQDEKNTPNVSKEIFYKVTEDLKDSLKEKQEFSLLSMFGKADAELETEVTADVKVTSTGVANRLIQERNPFRYDSSDDEDETEEIPNKEKTQSGKKTFEADKPRSYRTAFWSEPFFFTDDDYRLQEGVDFVEKMSTKEDNDFTKLRRNLKEIVKAKVRNNQRKNRPFKKKLGGSKKKKMLRIKKALKR